MFSVLKCTVLYCSELFRATLNCSILFLITFSFAKVLYSEAYSHQEFKVELPHLLLLRSSTGVPYHTRSTVNCFSWTARLSAKLLTFRSLCALLSLYITVYFILYIYPFWCVFLWGGDMKLVCVV
jgi:hypothetical protein